MTTRRAKARAAASAEAGLSAALRFGRDDRLVVIVGDGNLRVADTHIS
jgi:hypothetical protein